MMRPEDLVNPPGQTEGKVEENTEKNDEDREAELLRLDDEISRAVRALDHWIFRLRAGGGDREGRA